MEKGLQSKHLVHCNFDEGFNEKCYNKTVRIELGLKNDEECNLPVAKDKRSSLFR